MKLSRRIRDLVQAGLTSPRRFSGLGKARSPRRMEAQLEHIRKSLAQAAAREKGLQDELALAEGEGREQDAVRLRRELRELERSSDQLRAALDMIEARVEMAGESQAAEAAASPVAEGAGSPQASLADEGEDADLATRKARLAAPEAGERPEPEATKPGKSERD
jgi:hypothetical protein